MAIPSPPMPMHRSRRTLLAAALALPAAHWTLRPAQASGAPKTAAIPAPCDDFYEHVNGAWAAATEIPADRARVGSFDTLELRNQALLEQALTEAMADRSKLATAGMRLVTDYFASGLDAAAIERNGLASVQPLLAELDGLTDRARLPQAIAVLARHGLSAPLSVRAAPDARDRRRRSVSLWQGGLGLPDRDDYFSDDPRGKQVREAYRAHLARLLTLAGAGEAPAARAATEVLLFETRLAQASLKRSEMRDPTKLYHLRTLEELRTRPGALDYGALLAELGVQPARVVVGQPGFIDALNVAVREVPLSVWSTYLKLRLLQAVAHALPRAWQEAHFEFNNTVLLGQRQRRPRAEEVINQIGGRTGSEPLGLALGELFVARAFSPVAKQRALEMVEDIRAAMRARIELLDWMSAPTKLRAIAKLDAMVTQIGYPDRWKTYEGLVVDPKDYAGNWLRAARWETARQFGRLDQPVDRGEWFASPHVVNAFAGGFNNIVFPAGILQPPFFDTQADDATNFGGIGMVIGHEITHHFDDRGRRFDEVGNLAEWWTEDDARQYQARADRLAAQYSGYAPVPGHNINGVQTLGENISDLGGVKIAFDGLQRALARSPAKTTAGQPTPAQRFFISYATIWRDKMRTEALITRLRSGQHSPARYRVLGPLAHMQAFGEAFGCAPGDPMLRAEGERITIW